MHTTRPSQTPTLPAPRRDSEPDWRPLRDLAATGACLVLAALITALAIIFGGS